MPVFNRNVKPFAARRPIDIEYNDFSGGLNTIFRPTELDPNELAQADNLMLTGKGVPTGRWGSQNYFWAGSGYIRSLGAHVNPITDVNILYASTDAGYFVKKSGMSYALITGASFASGSYIETAQLGGFSYLVGGGKPLTRYDGTNLLVYATVPVPTGVGVSLVSGATGTSIQSWRVTALANGETTGSTGVTYNTAPIDLTTSTFHLAWSKVTMASGGYGIYRGTPGNETYIASVGPDTFTFTDQGSPQSDLKFPPETNTTAGLNAKYILRFDDRLVLAGVTGDPTIVYISGRYPYNDRFHWASGGGYIRINPDGGDEITGLGVAGSQTQGGSVPASILVYMKNSTHQLILKSVSIGNYLLLDPQVQMLAPTGCYSNRTIVTVENNTFSVGKEGINRIGQEPSFLQQLRVKELTAKIRPYFSNLSTDDLEKASAAYIDYKYLLSFPTRKETIVYDFQRRGAIMGPWKTPWGITRWMKYFDENNAEKWIAGTDNGYVKEFAASLTSDSGTAINKILRTRKEDFGNWTVMKVINTLYVLFRNIKGTLSVNIILEERSGTSTTSKNFTIQGGVGNAGWGTDGWGDELWGESGTAVTLTSEEIIRWANLYKTARVVQVEVISTGTQDNWEFLGLRASAQPLQEGSLNSAYRV